ncbi:MAG: lysophospholipid acyltransferase family protein [Trichloromonas sp.]|jgi:1-acyl-sn-glycerol-3-phosphate acyltransferase|nr:lysophospholipid acyltransferase family protein [Trichloromonas sp.]
MVRTLFYFATLIPWTLFVIVTGVPLSFISPDYLHNYARLWARVGLRLAGVRLKVSGREHLRAGEPVIYMSNHASNFDILALFAGLPGQFRWLAKEELFRIPLFGLAMRRAGYIPLDRSDRRKALHSMTEAAKRIRGGASVVIFPEGTRSADGILQPFKKGGFLIALKAGVPVQPVAISGSFAVMPKSSRRIHGGLIEVRILPAIATAELAAADTEKLLATVQGRIESAVEDCP